MEIKFTLIAYGFDGTIVATHDISGSIKEGVRSFREEIKSSGIESPGMSLRDNTKNEIVDFGIFTDIDGTEYVKIG